jgi:uncharacterized membrane protein YkoI
VISRFGPKPIGLRDDLESRSPFLFELGKQFVDKEKLICASSPLSMRLVRYHATRWRSSLILALQGFTGFRSREIAQMKSYNCALVVGLMLSFVVSVSRADEQKIAPDRLPKAVANAIQSKFQGAQLLSAEIEKLNGQTQYEVAIKHNNHAIEVTLTANGSIVSTKKEVTAAELPKPVVETVISRYPGANASKIQEIEENGKISYAIHFPVEQQRMTVRFDASGLPIERPAKSPAAHQMTFQIGDQEICRADFSAAAEGSRLIRLTSMNQEIRPAGASSFDQAGASRVFDQFLYATRGFGQSGLIPFTESDVLAVMRLLNPAESPQLDIWGNYTRQAAISILLWEADQTRASYWQAAWYDLAGKDLAQRTQFSKELIGIGHEALRPAAKSRDEKKN